MFILFDQHWYAFNISGSTCTDSVRRSRLDDSNGKSFGEGQEDRQSHPTSLKS